MIAIAKFDRNRLVVVVADKLVEDLLVLTFRIWISDPSPMIPGPCQQEGQATTTVSLSIMTTVALAIGDSSIELGDCPPNTMAGP